MIIKIYSPNKYLLDILYRNPNTDFGLYAKPLKNGIVIGNAMDANHYEIIFQDTKYSYLPEESNSIDYQSYCNPLVSLNIITEFFGAQLKSRQEYLQAEISWLKATYQEVDTEITTIHIPSFYIHSSWYRNEAFLLSKYFKGIKVKHKTGKIFELEISASTVFDAVNLLAITALLTHITNEYGMFTWIDDSFALKYARILTNLEDVPYFVFYLYIKRTVRSFKQFQLLKPIFEKYLKDQGFETDLSFYGTHQERIKYITDQLENDISILDIGCGELLYFKRMMNQKFQKNYHAVDVDANIHILSTHISNRFQGNQLSMYHDIDECTTTDLVNIIITEVIEHNTPENAKLLVLKALNFNFNKIFITTPNVSFNQFYGEDLASRHSDHHFEWNENEFEIFIRECVKDRPDVEFKIKQIGDKINNIQPTQTAILKKR